MGLLLDTHVFLWLVDDPSRLPSAAVDAVSIPDVELFLSLASVWELSIKVGLGKITLPLPPLEFVATRLERTDTELLGISLPHALALADLPRHHGDPFDRMLICQARAEGLTLVSSDLAMRAYDVPILWD